MFTSVMAKAKGFVVDMLAVLILGTFIAIAAALLNPFALRIEVEWMLPITLGLGLLLVVTRQRIRYVWDGLEG